MDSPVIPGVGCVVSPRGSQGWLDPGHPSVVAPGKRPRLTPAPAMAFVDGRVFMPFGTPGGDVQQQAMLQVFLNITVFGMRPSRRSRRRAWPREASPTRSGPTPTSRASSRSSADSAPRPATPWPRWATASERPDWEWRSGAVCAVVVADDGTLMAGADPRRGAHAIGW